MRFPQTCNPMDIVLDETYLTNSQRVTRKTSLKTNQIELHFNFRPGWTGRGGAVSSSRERRRVGREETEGNLRYMQPTNGRGTTRAMPKQLLQKPFRILAG